MSRVALLDVNLLLALFDPDHVHHEVAHDRFADERESGWATCPMTGNGFVRTASVVARSGEFVPVTVLAGSSRETPRAPRHLGSEDSARRRHRCATRVDRRAGRRLTCEGRKGRSAATSRIALIASSSTAEPMGCPF